MIPQPLKIIAARYSLGLVMMSDELCHAADAALDASLYSPSLAEVATTVHPLMSEVGPLFERAIQELGGALPSHEEAVRILLVDSIDSIASRKVSPRKGLERMLHEAYYLSGVEEKVGSYAGESFGIHALLGRFYDYDDLEERPAEVSFYGKSGAEGMALLDEEVIRLALEWLTRHGAKFKNEPLE